MTPAAERVREATIDGVLSEGTGASWQGREPGAETSFQIPLLQLDYIVSVTNAGGFRVNLSEDSLIIRVWEPSEKQDYIVREGALREREQG